MRPRVSSTAFFAASSMCLRRIRLSCRDMERNSLAEDLIAKVRAERLGRFQVHIAAKNSAQLFFHPDEVKEAGDCLRLELHENVDVALEREVIAQHRPEKRELPDVIPPAEVGDDFWRGRDSLRQIDRGGFHFSLILRSRLSRPRNDAKFPLDWMSWRRKLTKLSLMMRDIHTQCCGGADGHDQLVAEPRVERV